MTPRRRRWVFRSRNGDEALVVEVPRGGDAVVVLALPGGPLALHPADIGRVRRALHLAQAVAIADADDW